MTIFYDAKGLVSSVKHFVSQTFATRAILKIETAMHQTSTSSENFIAHLTNEFKRRKAKNSAYTLRSFARSLSISPATLSGVFSGKRILTSDMFLKIAVQLDLKPYQIKNYVSGFIANSDLPSAAKIEKLLGDDQFSMISNWIHFAILRLMKTAEFKPDPKWIASRLGLHVIEVRDAITRLERSGLLKIQDAKWTDVSDGHSSYVKSETTTIAIKNFLKQMKEKSAKSLDEDPITIRNHTGMMMTLSKDSLPKAKELITEFRKSLAEIMENDKKKLDEVYFLEVGFFPLTKTKKNDNEV